LRTEILPELANTVIHGNEKSSGLFPEGLIRNKTMSMGGLGHVLKGMHGALCRGMWGSDEMI
jgi:hypothetical protein